MCVIEDGRIPPVLMHQEARDFRLVDVPLPDGVGAVWYDEPADCLYKVRTDADDLLDRYPNIALLQGAPVVDVTALMMKLTDDQCREILPALQTQLNDMLGILP